jgi:cytochrome c oxidase subunit 6b
MSWSREEYPFLSPVKGNPDQGTLWTPLFDPRFPTTNQTKNCWANYVEYQRCRLLRDDQHPDCRKYLRTFTSLCPTEWTDAWDEQREAGIFPGQLAWSDLIEK